MKTIKDVDVQGRRVLMRVDYNVPLNEDGSVRDSTRIEATLATIHSLLEKGASQIVLMTHVGRPKGKEVPELRTDGIAKKLSELLGMNVAKTNGWEALEDEKVVLLENLRFNPAETSKEEDIRDTFGKQLAALGDVYINEAFSNCHRNHASMTSIPKFIPGCVGPQVEHEVSTLTKAVSDPEKPVIAIIGGVKEEKIKAIEKLLDICDHILLGGSMIFWVMKARGDEIGDSKIDIDAYLDFEEKLREFANDSKIIMPTDFVIADSFSANAEFKISDSCPPGWLGLDIGPESISTYKKMLTDAKTVLWFGPIGVFEFKEASHGTEEIAHVLASLDALKISGGGESGEAITEFGLAKEMDLISTGGGAALKLISGETLPALEILK